METKEKDEAFELVELGAVTEETRGEDEGVNDQGFPPFDKYIPE